MKSFSVIASILALAAMTCAAPAQDAQEVALSKDIQAAVDINNALDAYNKAQDTEEAMKGHNLCACQVYTKGQLMLLATIAACSDLGGQMESMNREVGINSFQFYGQYCRQHNTLKLSGRSMNISCRNHGAGDSACPE